MGKHFYYDLKIIDKGSDFKLFVKTELRKIFKCYKKGKIL